jgi:hypothetical protein
MSNPDKSGDHLIDRFVAALNDRGMEPLPAEEVPEDLRNSNPLDDSDWVEWTIRAADSTPWVAALDSRLKKPFPELYHSLITRYRFAEFEIGPVMFFASTGQDVLHELSRCIFRDQYMSPVLLNQGLLQFGQPDSGNYDPICFDARRGKLGDAPIVRIDHEDILSRNKSGRLVAEIAPSFRDFVERAIAGAFDRP